MIITKQYVKGIFGKRKSDSHKGDFGRVLVVGGSIDYSGAPALASVAALRAGVDIVTVAAPSKVAWAINSQCPDIITKKLKGEYLSPKHVPEIKKLLEKHDVLLIGPGLSQKEGTKKAVVQIIKTKKPKVVDADALKAIDLKEINDAILTPHQMEFKTLLKNSKLNNNNFNKFLNNNVILLKRKEDKIISETKIAINKTGSPGMTVGGTGDILAGLCAGFLALSGDLFKSACAAAYVNGIIGEELERKYRHGFIASDFLAIIAKKMKEEFG
ncbi:NAD(P)H-hydrate dehydratase [Candidatus Woesearchaeota archaeon]|nr:NAD(P)H-hydrate dehydratase [Candidatus Woesearchaeota archaeon]